MKYFPREMIDWLIDGQTSAWVYAFEVRQRISVGMSRDQSKADVNWAWSFPSILGS